jgi:2-C-methyl-D-erythritol 4-phosphate cytidylyltransferase
VILPAAGSGRRFGAPENKIFAPLAGRAVFLRTCELFAARDDVRQMLLVVSAEDRARVEGEYGEALGAWGVQVVTGGAMRTDSVRAALARVDAAADLVAIHDAVRPCVAGEHLDAVFALAGETGAAMLASPVHATLKRVDADGVITGTVSREGLWEAQTPQVFARALIVDAYAQAREAFTDDAQLVEAMGRAVRVSPGDRRNVKITTPDDLALAEQVWSPTDPPAGRGTSR